MYLIETLSFCLPSFRDRPSVFYFDILKCATSVNVMATALNGFQCPTTQVEAADFIFFCFFNDTEQSTFPGVTEMIIFLSLPKGVR